MPVASRHSCIPRLAAAIVLAWTGAAIGFGQTAITSITTSTSSSPSQILNGVTFDGTDLKLSSFTSADGTYQAISVGTSVSIDRESDTEINSSTGTANADNTSVYYAQNRASSSEMQASYQSTLGGVLLGNNLLVGSDNTFANGTSADSGNIERLDFLLNGSTGITATSSTAFAILERGAAGAHDSFEITAITGFNSQGQATYAQSQLLTVTSSSYGSSNVGVSQTYGIFRYSTGDALKSWTAEAPSTSQGIGGVVVTLADLGIAPGTTVYGYSIMAADVTDGGNTANLTNWQNPTYYPTNTSPLTGGSGGFDLLGVNGIVFNRVIPEPGTYGAIFMGACLGIIAMWRLWAGREGRMARR